MTIFANESNFMQTLNQQPITLSSLTGIRGVFAVWVLFYHILIGLEVSNVGVNITRTLVSSE